jgi:hypothetical protein
VLAQWEKGKASFSAQGLGTGMAESTRHGDQKKYPVTFCSPKATSPSTTSVLPKGYDKFSSMSSTTRRVVSSMIPSLTRICPRGTGWGGARSPPKPTLLRSQLLVHNPRFVGTMRRYRLVCTTPQKSPRDYKPKYQPQLPHMAQGRSPLSTQLLDSLTPGSPVLIPWDLRKAPSRPMAPELCLLVPQTQASSVLF